MIACRYYYIFKSFCGISSVLCTGFIYRHIYCTIVAKLIFHHIHTVCVCISFFDISIQNRSSINRLGFTTKQLHADIYERKISVFKFNESENAFDTLNCPTREVELILLNQPIGNCLFFVNHVTKS